MIKKKSHMFQRINNNYKSETFFYMELKKKTTTTTTKDNNVSVGVGRWVRAVGSLELQIHTLQFSRQKHLQRAAGGKRRERKLKSVREKLQ